MGKPSEEAWSLRGIFHETEVAKLDEELPGEIENADELASRYQAVTTHRDFDKINKGRWNPNNLGKEHRRKSSSMKVESGARRSSVRSGPAANSIDGCRSAKYSHARSQVGRYAFDHGCQIPRAILKPNRLKVGFIRLALRHFVQNLDRKLVASRLDALLGLHAVPVTGTAVVLTGVQRVRTVTRRSVVRVSKFSTGRDGVAVIKLDKLKLGSRKHVPSYFEAGLGMNFCIRWAARNQAGKRLENPSMVVISTAVDQEDRPVAVPLRFCRKQRRNGPATRRKHCEVINESCTQPCAPSPPPRPLPNRNCLLASPRENRNTKRHPAPFLYRRLSIGGETAEGILRPTSLSASIQARVLRRLVDIWIGLDLHSDVPDAPTRLRICVWCASPASPPSSTPDPSLRRLCPPRQWYLPSDSTRPRLLAIYGSPKI
ncbi:hypothetical protein C8R45DRAFT_935632 [Mycena sanguinolenta]|nr:hypothetical protein C8R45DRAFT_935632 [Mycena sanguinolenta]